MISAWKYITCKYTKEMIGFWCNKGNIYVVLELTQWVNTTKENIK